MAVSQTRRATHNIAAASSQVSVAWHWPVTSAVFSVVYRPSIRSPCKPTLFLSRKHSDSKIFDIALLSAIAPFDNSIFCQFPIVTRFWDIARYWLTRQSHIISCAPLFNVSVKGDPSQFPHGICFDETNYGACQVVKKSDSKFSRFVTIYGGTNRRRDRQVIKFS